MPDSIQKVSFVLLGSLLTAVWLWGLARYESKLRRRSDDDKNAYKAYFLLRELYSLLSIQPAPGLAMSPGASIRNEGKSSSAGGSKLPVKL